MSLKLISLILAVLLELYFYSPDNSVSVTVLGSIEVRNVPSSFMFINPPRGEKGIPARIEIRGPRPLVEQVRASTHRFEIEYPPDQPLLYTVNVDYRQLWLPPGVEVLEVSPSNLTLEFEHKVEKKLPVEVEKTGQLPPGYRLDGITVTPDSISAQGPESELGTLQSLKTQKLNLDGVTDSRKFELALDFRGKLSQLGAHAVTVEVLVSPIPGEKSFEKVSVRVLAPHGFAGTVEPSKVKVKLAGPKEALDKLTSASIELQADGRELTEGRHEVPVVGSLPPGVSVYSSEPKQVTVNLVKQ